MKIHIRNFHNTKPAIKAMKRLSTLTPIQNTPKRAKPVFNLNNESIANESMFSLASAPDEHPSSALPLTQCDSRPRVEGSTVFACSFCTFESENRDELIKHITTHSTTSCEDCNLVFESELALDRHIDEVHIVPKVTKVQSLPKVRLYPCHSCDFHATTQHVLGDHMETSHLNKRNPKSTADTGIESQKVTKDKHIACIGVGSGLS